MEEIIQDQFHLIGKLANKLDKTQLPVGLTEIKTEDLFCFLNISLIEKPQVIYSFKITSDLQFCVWYEGENIKEFVRYYIKNSLFLHFCLRNP